MPPGKNKFTDALKYNNTLDFTWNSFNSLHREWVWAGLDLVVHCIERLSRTDNAHFALYMWCDRVEWVVCREYWFWDIYIQLKYEIPFLSHYFQLDKIFYIFGIISQILMRFTANIALWELSQMNYKTKIW